MEYHVPERYDTKRPGLTWTVVEHEMNIESHLEGLHYPPGAQASRSDVRQ